MNCLTCGKKIRELKIRQTNHYCSDECAHEKSIGDIPSAFSVHGSNISNKSTAGIYVSESNPSWENGIRILEDKP